MPKSILIVDDELSIREALSLLFKDAYNIFLAKDAAEAEKFLNENKIDLMLLDYLMPKTNGLKFLHQIKQKQEYKDLPIVLLTGVVGCDIMNSIYFYPNTYCLKKPTGIFELINIVQWKMGDNFLNREQIIRENDTDAELNIVRMVCDFIDANYFNPELCPEIFSKISSVAIQKLNEYFYNRIGHTPMKQLAAVRIKRAIDFLKNDELTMDKIAILVGIKNVKTFYNLFRKYTGVTPYKCRKKT